MRKIMCLCEWGNVKGSKGRHLVSDLKNFVDCSAVMSVLRHSLTA